MQAAGSDIIVLAAGESSRLGRPKQLLRLDGITLLERAVASARGSGGRRVFVVVGAFPKGVASVLPSEAVEVISNPDWKRGIGTSIRTGLVAVLAQSEPPAGVLLMTSDQPLVNTAMLARLISAGQEGDVTIAACRYDSTVGIPAWFAPVHFRALQSLQDHQGAKELIQNHLEETLQMETPEAALDVDTEEDWLRLKEVAERKRR